MKVSTFYVDLSCNDSFEFDAYSMCSLLQSASSLDEPQIPPNDILSTPDFPDDPEGENDPTVSTQELLDFSGVKTQDTGSPFTGFPSGTAVNDSSLHDRSFTVPEFRIVSEERRQRASSGRTQTDFN